MSPAQGSAILALNAGSSSLKFGLFTARDPREVIARGSIERMDEAPHFTAAGAAGEPLVDRKWPRESPDHSEVTGTLLDWIDAHLEGRPLASAGHRIVHGGDRFAGPARIDPASLAAIEALTPLAPLHQPLGILPIRAVADLRPKLMQYACFDTSFHRTIGLPQSRYAVPRALELEGIRRFGFHGLSYAHVAQTLLETQPALAAGRVVVAHLGSGASLCGMRGGCSVDTTMGFSVLDGLVMGTRPGNLDAGVLLYLLKEKRMSPDQLEHLLYHESGLLGVSGLSGDVRPLFESLDPRAREALELFAFRAAREIAAMATSLGGLDALVFTAGIGEHSAPMRAMIAAHLAWLGVQLDPGANELDRAVVSARDSAVAVLIVPTDEEMTIARAATELGAGRGSDARA